MSTNFTTVLGYVIIHLHFGSLSNLFPIQPFSPNLFLILLMLDYIHYNMWNVWGPLYFRVITVSDPFPVILNACPRLYAAVECAIWYDFSSISNFPSRLSNACVLMCQGCAALFANIGADMGTMLSASYTQLRVNDMYYKVPTSFTLLLLRQLACLIRTPHSCIACYALIAYSYGASVIFCANTAVEILFDAASVVTMPLCTHLHL